MAPKIRLKHLKIDEDNHLGLKSFGKILSKVNLRSGSHWQNLAKRSQNGQNTPKTYPFYNWCRQSFEKRFFNPICFQSKLSVMPTVSAKSSQCKFGFLGIKLTNGTDTPKNIKTQKKFTYLKKFSLLKRFSTFLFYLPVFLDIHGNSKHKFFWKCND